MRTDQSLFDCQRATRRITADVSKAIRASLRAAVHAAVETEIKRLAGEVQRTAAKREAQKIHKRARGADRAEPTAAREWLS